jgi:hypothetical protein
VSCSSNVKVTFDGIKAPDVFIKWPKTEDGKGVEQEVIIEASNFKTDQINCPI